MMPMSSINNIKKTYGGSVILPPPEPDPAVGLIGNYINQSTDQLMLEAI